MLDFADPRLSAMLHRLFLAVSILGILSYAPAPLLAGPLEDATAAEQRGDERTAIQILQPIAEAGDSTAQYRLGMWFRYGTHRDASSAIKWLHLAAEKNNSKAQRSLGEIYLDGMPGASKNANEAIKWLTRAAEGGDADSQLMLGLAYENGEKIPRDYAQAAKFLQLAANQGNPNGMGFLGYQYLFGHGVPQDYVMAYMWFNLAASRPREKIEATGLVGDITRGAQESVLNGFGRDRDNLALRMTRDQIAEAQRLTRNWKPAPQKSR
jgi:uncharacterized protein